MSLPMFKALSDSFHERERRADLRAGLVAAELYNSNAWTRPAERIRAEDFFPDVAYLAAREEERAARVAEGLESFFFLHNLDHALAVDGGAAAPTADEGQPLL